MNVVLIGFCSSGKSSTAFELAQRLNKKFVDLDKEIEVRYYLHYGHDLHYRDIIFILLAVSLFFALRHIGLFRTKIPQFFEPNVRSLGREINLYTSIFVLVNLTVLFQLLY